MPEIHYTDAMITVMVGGGFAFAIWSSVQLNRLQLKMMKLEKKLTKKIAKANAQGALLVQGYFDKLIAKKGEQ